VRFHGGRKGRRYIHSMSGENAPGTMSLPLKKADSQETAQRLAPASSSVIGSFGSCPSSLSATMR
jgi:hypothetical protein